MLLDKKNITAIKTAYSVNIDSNIASDVYKRQGLMNNIRDCADEIVLNDIVYS